MNAKKTGIEIIIPTKELIHALSLVSSVVEKRNVMAILGNIKLEAKENLLVILATDMDLSISQKIGAEVVSEGQTTVSVQTLSDIVRKIPDKEIKLSLNLETELLEIVGKNCHFSLSTLPANQFPAMEQIKAESAIKIPCTKLAHIIDSTKFAMSTEETRYNLNGVYLHIKDTANGTMFISAATDGHRLSVSGVEINVANQFGVILPRKTAQEVLKIIKDPKNIDLNTQIQLGLNRIKFICNDIEIVSKLIDGSFPEYNSFIPDSNPNKLSISTKLLAAAIDRVSTVTIDKFRAVKISLSKDGIEVSASGEAKGIAVEQIKTSDNSEEFCSYQGEPLIIGFNPKYLLDVLSSIESDRVEVDFKDSFSPTLIKNQGQPHDNFVVMPVKV